jgi:ribonuclease III
MTELAKLFGLDADGARYAEALSHPSHANETRSGLTYQRLEFLGDAVLELCTSELLYLRFPQADEGSLTRMRAQLVNADALAEWGREHGVDEAVRLGRGADAGGLRASTSVVSDVVEALIGAAFLDGGLPAARGVCERIVKDRIAGFDEEGALDPKSALQEQTQRGGGMTPGYTVVAQGGSAHDPWFEVSVRLGDRELGRGRGRSKRLAERAAAHVALEQLSIPVAEGVNE